MPMARPPPSSSSPPLGHNGKRLPLSPLLHSSSPPQTPQSPSPAPSPPLVPPPSNPSPDVKLEHRAATHKQSLSTGGASLSATAPAPGPTPSPPPPDALPANDPSCPFTSFGKGQDLVKCMFGFATGTLGGLGGVQYVVTDPSDNPDDPTPGTLRYGVLAYSPVWITFAADMTIDLEE
eukprot:SM005820S18593  [mRNA]  locus=s5820:278:808:- [translate_table: standard]